MQRREQRNDVREQLEVARIAPLLLGRRPDLLGPAGPRPCGDDLDREPAMLSAAVLERLDAEDVECIEAGLLVALGSSARRSGPRAPCIRARRTPALDGST